MTITTTTRKATGTGNGVVTNFPHSFFVKQSDDLEVYLYDITLDTSTLLASSLYTVNGVGNNSGSVDYPLTGSPITSNFKIITIRVVEYIQNLDANNQDGILLENVEIQLDDVVMQIQQVADKPDGPLNPVANAIAVFDAAGNLINGIDIADVNNAANSATAAALSETNAAASYDAFDDRYLGDKTADPTLDNDGNALLTGALYFNSTVDEMRIWNGAAWIATFTTISGALVAANNLADLTNVPTAQTNLQVYSKTASDTRYNPAASLARNLIINGDFQVWQRGTSFNTGSTRIYTCDRWSYLRAGAAAHTVSQSTDVPTVVQSGHKSVYSFLIDCTTAATTLASTDFTILIQILEGYDFVNIAEKEFTLSFWVKATKIGTYCVAFRNNGVDKTYVAEYTVDVTNTWEKKTITVSASPSTGTWDYTDGIGLQVTFTLAAGTSIHTTPDAWNTGSFLATVNQINATDSISNDFRLSQVQIVEGAIATDFDNGGKFADVLAICQRYYTTRSVNFASDIISGSVYGIDIAHIQNMRVIPALVFSNNVVNGFPLADPSVSNSTKEKFLASSTASSSVTNGAFSFTYTADAEL